MQRARAAIWCVVSAFVALTVGAAGQGRL